MHKMTDPGLHDEAHMLIVEVCGVSAELPAFLLGHDCLPYDITSCRGQLPSR
jgi:hypothetical protein